MLEAFLFNPVTVAGDVRFGLGVIPAGLVLTCETYNASGRTRFRHARVQGRSPHIK